MWPGVLGHGDQNLIVLFLAQRLLTLKVWIKPDHNFLVTYYTDTYADSEENYTILSVFEVAQRQALHSEVFDETELSSVKHAG